MTSTSAFLVTPPPGATSSPSASAPTFRPTAPSLFLCSPPHYQAETGQLRTTPRSASSNTRPVYARATASLAFEVISRARWRRRQRRRLPDGHASNTRVVAEGISLSLVLLLLLFRLHFFVSPRRRGAHTHSVSSSLSASWWCWLLLLLATRSLGPRTVDDVGEREREREIAGTGATRLLARARLPVRVCVCVCVCIRCCE